MYPMFSKNGGKGRAMSFYASWKVWGWSNEEKVGAYFVVPDTGSSFPTSSRVDACIRCARSVSVGETTAVQWHADHKLARVDAAVFGVPADGIFSAHRC